MTALIVVALLSLSIGAMIGYATAAIMFISAEIDRHQNKEG
jgi:hypothetical protein